MKNGKNAQDVMKIVKMIGGFLMLNGKDMFLENGGEKTFAFLVIFFWLGVVLSQKVKDFLNARSLVLNLNLDYTPDN